MEFWEWWFRERDLLIEKCAPIFMFHVIHEFFIPKRLEDFQVFALPRLETTWSNFWVEKVPNWLSQNLSKQSTSWDWAKYTLPLFWRKGFFILQKKRLKTQINVFTCNSNKNVKKFGCSSSTIPCHRRVLVFDDCFSGIGFQGGKNGLLCSKNVDACAWNMSFAIDCMWLFPEGGCQFFAVHHLLKWGPNMMIVCLFWSFLHRVPVRALKLFEGIDQIVPEPWKIELHVQK